LASTFLGLGIAVLRNDKTASQASFELSRSLYANELTGFLKVLETE
jgi:hypothetical protein